MEERDRGHEQAADRETKDYRGPHCCGSCLQLMLRCTLQPNHSFLHFHCSQKLSLAALYLLPRQKPENWTCHEPKLTTASTLGQRNAICCSETWLKRACVTCKRQDATGRGPATSSHRFTSTPFKALKKCHQMAYFKSSSSHDHICIWRFSAVNYS